MKSRICLIALCITAFFFCPWQTIFAQCANTMDIVETGGPANPPAPAKITDALYFEEGNFAQAPDAVAFSSPPGSSERPVALLIDRNYGSQNGEANSYQTGVPGATTNEIYAGVYWADGARNIGEVSIGRDATEVLTNGTSGDWEFEVTTDTLDGLDGSGADGAVTDEEVAAATWTCVGVVASDPKRNKYEFPDGNVSATAIRIIADGG